MGVSRGFSRFLPIPSAAAAALPLVCVGLLPGQARLDDPSREYQVKAEFLVNFTSFAGWPARMLPAADSPVSICVLGRDPFGHQLDDAANGRTAQGRPLRIRRVESVRASLACHVVFLPNQTWSHRPDLVEFLTLQGILTVGDSERFARNGGVIGFVVRDQTVRFVINLRAADRGGLRISSRLLALASSVYRPPEAGS